MPRSKKENIEEITLDPIEEKAKEPAPEEVEPVERPEEEPETVEEDAGEEITEPVDFEEPEDVEFDEDAEPEEETGDEESDEGDEPAPFLGLMMSGAKNAPVSEDPDPQSRIEALLWHIINGTTTDAVPQSRNEAILTAIANSGTYSEEAQSRIEALLITILNHEEIDITPISRNEAILKAIANNTEYNEEPKSRNEELLIKWLEAISIVIGTASGAVASFNTSLTENLLSAVAEFSASQASGTPTPSTPIPIVGVDKVNVSDCGKNICGGSKLLANAQAYIPNGTTDTENKTFSFGSTAQTTAGKTFTSGIKFKENTKYTIIITASKSNTNASSNMRYYYTDGSYTNIMLGDTIEADTKYTKVFYTNPNKTLAYISKIGSSGTTHLYYDECGIFEGDLSETDFEPYNGTTAIINLGGTYYGGSVDAVTGKITNEYDKYVFDGTETWIQYASGVFYTLVLTSAKYADNQVVSCEKYLGKMSAAGNANYPDLSCWLQNSETYKRFYIKDTTLSSTTDAQNAMNGIKVKYPLATPIVVYASNTAEIPTIAGANQVYADTGDVAVEYKKRRND